jgi:hypothetical protein
MTADEQLKLKKELTTARDRPAQDPRTGGTNSMSPAVLVDRPCRDRHRGGVRWVSFSDDDLIHPQLT